VEAENTRVYPAGLSTDRKLLPTVRKAATVALIAKKCGPWANFPTSFILLVMVVVAPGKLRAHVPLDSDVTVLRFFWCSLM
jgi:hypothetical protein